MSEMANGCVQPAGGPIRGSNDESRANGGQADGQKEERMIARVGQAAPD